MNGPSPPQSPATALERRERRPTATVLFLALLFALPMGTCGGIGTWKATDAGRKQVPTDAGRLASTSDGEYVSFDATLREVGTDKVPLGDGTAVEVRGTTVYAVEGPSPAYVAAKTGTLRAGSGVHVEGRVCSQGSHLVCAVDDDGLRLFLRMMERQADGRPIKLVTSGATPSENIWEAAVGLVIAGFLGLVLLAVAIVIIRGRRKPLIFVERVVPIRQELDPARLRAILGPGFREAQVTADTCVFLTGVTASRAQAVGAFSPDAYPQRVEIWREPGGGGGYRQLSARVRVSEIFAQPAGPLPQIMPTLQVALEATLQRVVTAMNA